MTEKTNALAQAAMKLGEAMYKAQQEQAGTAETGPDAEASSAQPDEEVVDAEFSEVDDENKG